MSKSFFVDTTRCTACRGCQIACKQWHKLPAEETRNWGSHQNPKDLSFHTYKLVRMTEQVVDGQLKWLFFPDQCRHCVEPPCKEQGDFQVENAIIKDELTGAVIFTEKTALFESPNDVIDACPYSIPRMDKEGSKILGKCDMCLDRVHNGLLPACVLSCPTGAMNFGDREEMLALAKKRQAQIKGSVLGDAEEVRTIYLFEYDPKLYHEYSVAEAGPRLFTRKQMLAKVFRPGKRA